MVSVVARRGGEILVVDQWLRDRLDGIDCLGILLWGSHAKGDATERSDVDLCIVAGPDRDRTQILRAVWAQVGKQVDVKVFEDLPVYLQGEVFEAHRVLSTEDEPTLYEYLRPFWKRWRDQVHRQRLTTDEARGLFSA